MSEGVVLAGLPATGKTSYLALIFHAIVEERADGLCLGRFDDDREHITEISDVLLASTVADRTLADDDQDVTLSLTCGGRDFVLAIPDLSGEMWEHALVDRQWSTALDETVAAAAGFMVFVHCDEVNGGLTIVEAEQAAAAILGDDDAPDAPNGTAEADESDAVVDQTSDEDEDEETHCKQLTQVSLVELIQLFAARSRRPARVSVVISAWDRMPENLRPSEWLAKNAPLLDQYVRVNGEEVEAAVWGVSAQGAHLAHPEVREQYKDKDPIDRARVLAADGSPAGIAAPLCWVLRLDQ